MLSTLVASPTTVAADGSSFSTLTVTLRDVTGQPIVGDTVSLSALSGSSVISPSTALSDGSGVAVFTVTDTVVESVTYQATDIDENVLLVQTATVNFENTPPPGPTPPSDFKGVWGINKFATQTEFLNILSWVRSLDPTVVGYRVYEGAKLVAAVSSIALEGWSFCF